MCLCGLLRRIWLLNQFCDCCELGSIASTMDRGHPPRRWCQLLGLLHTLAVNCTGTPRSERDIGVIPCLNVISHFFVAKVYQLLLQRLHIHSRLLPPFLLCDCNVSTGLPEAFDSFNWLIRSPIALGFQHMRISEQIIIDAF
jgi:hypothetical protein